MVAGSIYPNVNSDRQKEHDATDTNPDDYSGFMERVTSNVTRKCSVLAIIIKK